jgi:two-component system, OmpR family, sensor histidine kinase KdpD
VNENIFMAKTPDQWLEEVSPSPTGKGVLKVFLGYAPGVGKTFVMLSEAIRRHSRGEDVVIGYVETHGRKAVADLAAQVEEVPRKKIEYKGTIFEEMDPDAIIARNPRVVLVDELAHTNIPGSKHRKRYEDVLELVEAKMEVLCTMNVQHLESVAPTVGSIVGIKVRETIPDWVLQHASEIVMTDLTPEALQNRMKRGDIYHTEKVDQALKNFFRRGNLIALRELALRQVAEQVDRSLETYMVQKDIHDLWPVRERIAVCFSSNPRAQYLIARAARMARRMDAELYAVYVDMGQDSSAQDQKSLGANIQFSESLGAKVVQLKGRAVSTATAGFVREKHVTQVIFGRSAVQGWRKYMYVTAINRFLREAPAVDVHIVTQEPD